MIPITMSNPIKDYSPVAIFNLKPLPETSEIKLLVKNRYCDLDLATGVAYLYLELSDNTNTFILPVRYYQWLAAQNAEFIYCKYIKIQKDKTYLNVLELSRIPKTFLSICNSDETVNPLQNGNVKIQTDYVPLHREFIELTRVLQKQSDILYYGLATATLGNGTYIKAHSRVKDLFTLGRVGVQYRYINIGQKIITDLEVFSDEF